jgi:hypothetical protein
LALARLFEFDLDHVVVALLGTTLNLAMTTVRSSFFPLSWLGLAQSFLLLHFAPARLQIFIPQAVVAFAVADNGRTWGTSNSPQLLWGSAHPYARRSKLRPVELSLCLNSD